MPGLDFFCDTVTEMCFNHTARLLETFWDARSICQVGRSASR
jgi:hypothetical protein